MRGFQATCNPCDNYMHFTGYPVRCGISPHFFGGEKFAVYFLWLSVIHAVKKWIVISNKFPRTVGSSLSLYNIQCTISYIIFWLLIWAEPKKLFWIECSKLHNLTKIIGWSLPMCTLVTTCDSKSSLVTLMFSFTIVS